MINKKQFMGRLLVIIAAVLVIQSLYMPAKAVAAQILLQLAWQRTLMTGVDHKPWPWADTTTLARLKFPELDERLILLAGSMGRTLAFAPGHMSGSSLPNEDGHMIISAHRDTHFAMLENIKIGHHIEIQDKSGRRKVFQVQAIRIVDSRKEQVVMAHERGQLTLITCYPFAALQAGGPLRMRVDAILVKSDVI